MRVAELQARLVEFPEDATVYITGMQCHPEHPREAVYVYQDDARRDPETGQYPVIISVP